MAKITYGLQQSLFMRMRAPSIMHRIGFVCVILGLTMLLGARAESQEIKEFIVGRCPGPDSLAHPDLSAVVDEPAHRPTVLTFVSVGAAAEWQAAHITGGVRIAMVIDTSGRVVPGTMAVMESNSVGLSKWVCANPKRFLFKPATDSTGKPVVAQATMPYSINLIEK